MPRSSSNCSPTPASTRQYGDDGDADNIAAEEFFEGIAHLAIWEHGEKSLLVQYLLAVLEDMRYQTGTGTLSYLIKPEEYEEERARG